MQPLKQLILLWSTLVLVAYAATLIPTLLIPIRQPNIAPGSQPMPTVATVQPMPTVATVQPMPTLTRAQLKARFDRTILEAAMREYGISYEEAVRRQIIKYEFGAMEHRIAMAEPTYQGASVNPFPEYRIVVSFRDPDPAGKLQPYLMGFDWAGIVTARRAPLNATELETLQAQINTIVGQIPPRVTTRIDLEQAKVVIYTSDPDPIRDRLLATTEIAPLIESSILFVQQEGEPTPVPTLTPWFEQNDLGHILNRRWLVESGGFIQQGSQIQIDRLKPLLITFGETWLEIDAMGCAPMKIPLHSLIESYYMWGEPSDDPDNSCGPEAQAQYTELIDALLTTNTYTLDNTQLVLSGPQSQILLWREVPLP